MCSETETQNGLREEDCNFFHSPTPRPGILTNLTLVHQFKKSYTQVHSGQKYPCKKKLYKNVKLGSTDLSSWSHFKEGPMAEYCLKSKTKKKVYENDL